MGPLLVALVVVASSAASQPPTPASGPRGQEPKSEAAKAENDTTHDGDSAKNITFVINTFSAENPGRQSDHIGRDQNNGATAEDKTATWTKVIGVVTGFLVLATVALAFFTMLIVGVTGFQAWMFWKQLRLMETATRDAGTAAQAASENAKSAVAQAKALAAGSRAYVGVKSARLELLKGKDVWKGYVVFTVINGGQTAAGKVNLSVNLTAVDHDRVEIRSNPRSYSETYLIPGVPWNCRHVMKPLDNETANKIKSHKLATLLFSGCVSYVDVFGDRHYSHFRFVRGIRLSTEDDANPVIWDVEIDSAGNSAT